MHFTSRVEGIDEYIYDLEVSDAYREDSPLKEGINRLDHPLVQTMDARYITTDGLIIIHCKMGFSIASTDNVHINGEAILMGFGLSGEEGNFEIDQLSAPTPARLEFHNLIYTPEYKAKFTVPAGRSHNYILVILSKDFYFRLFSEDLAYHKDFVNKVLERKHTRFSPDLLTVSPIIKQVLMELLMITQNSKLPRILLETKIKELLILQWEHFSFRHPDSKHPVSNLEKAKEYLDAHFVNPPLLSELAKIVLLNEARLKRGFKELYGISVYQYIIRLKMKYALLLLKSSEFTISEIAEKVGYSTSAHFSNAFLKYYGYRPGQVI